MEAQRLLGQVLRPQLCCSRLGTHLFPELSDEYALAGMMNA